jgi:glycosyltransferase involved in cell wall biosynthesis
VTTVHAVWPDGVDDPRRPSGGNVYDRRLCEGLRRLGWSVSEHAVAGSWPHPGAAALSALAGLVAGIPDGSVVLIDGLIGSAAPEAIVPHASRLRLVVLVHMPLSDRPSGPEVVARETAVLRSAAAIITTSDWARSRVIELHGIARERVHVAHPGTAPAPAVTGSPGGGALLCVAAVIADKGHDVLADALATLTELSWSCVCVGALDRDPPFVRDLRRRLAEHGLDRRVSFAGPLVGADLDRAYAAADLLVLASRAETYGMVLTEALARGLPVITADVGGVTEALGPRDPRPGLLVAPGDAAALADALRAWLSDAGLRARLRDTARARRATLPGWGATASTIAGVLEAFLA